MEKIMGFREEITSYREPKTRIVGLQPNPKDHSTDNGILFSATYISLLSPYDRSKEKDWFETLVEICEIEPGRYARYPGDLSNEAWDDLIGVIVGSYALGLSFPKDILNYGIKTDWVWNNAKPGEWTSQSWLKRYPDFESLVRVACGLPLGLDHQALVAGSYMADWFTPHDETSGRCLLYLKSSLFENRYSIIDAALSLWRARMNSIYPGGPKELRSVYFGASHPLTLFSPTHF